MNGHQLHYDGFLYICIVTFQNTYKPEIFHKYIAWLSLNSKKIHHYLLLNKTQKDGPHLSENSHKKQHIAKKTW